MKDNYERLRKEYLNICDEDCGGDPSTGIQPCPFFEYEEGCLLKSEKFRAAPGELNNLAAAVHENAVAHGWWEQERELPEILMLCVSELAEALEEYRAGRPNIYYNVEGEEILYANGEACEKYERRKPEGVAVELADCMIRILDYCGHAGIDIEEAIRIKHEYNKTRLYRHGGKKC